MVAIRRPHARVSAGRRIRARADRASRAGRVGRGSRVCGAVRLGLGVSSSAVAHGCSTVAFVDPALGDGTAAGRDVGAAGGGRDVGHVGKSAATSGACAYGNLGSTEVVVVLVLGTAAPLEEEPDEGADDDETDGTRSGANAGLCAIRQATAATSSAASSSAASSILATLGLSWWGSRSSFCSNNTSSDHSTSHCQCAGDGDSRAGIGLLRLGDHRSRGGLGGCGRDDSLHDSGDDCNGIATCSDSLCDGDGGALDNVGTNLSSLGFQRSRGWSRRRESLNSDMRGRVVPSLRVAKDGGSRICRLGSRGLTSASNSSSLKHGGGVDNCSGAGGGFGGGSSDGLACIAHSSGDSNGRVASTTAAAAASIRAATRWGRFISNWVWRVGGD